MIPQAIYAPEPDPKPKPETEALASLIDMDNLERFRPFMPINFN